MTSTMPAGSPSSDAPSERKPARIIVLTVIGVLVVAAIAWALAARPGTTATVNTPLPASSPPTGPYRLSDECQTLDVVVKLQFDGASLGLQSYTDVQPHVISQPPQATCAWSLPRAAWVGITFNVYPSPQEAKAYYDSLVASMDRSAIAKTEVDTSGKEWEGWVGIGRNGILDVMLFFTHSENAVVIMGAAMSDRQYKEFTDPAREWSAPCAPVIDQAYLLMRG